MSSHFNTTARSLLLASLTMIALKTNAATTTVTVTCDGTGKTDATACLNTALNGGGTRVVNLVAGKTYKLLSNLYVPSNVTLNGNGAYLTMGTPTETIWQMLNVGGSNVNVNNTNFSYSGPNTGLAALTLASNASNITLTQNYFTGANLLAAIYSASQGNANVNINHNTINGTRFGILTNAEWGVGVALAKYQTNWVIEYNHISEVSGDGIEINSPVLALAPKGSAVMGVAANNFTIDHNTISAPYSKTSSAGFCIGLAGVAYATVTSNILSNCKWQGIHIEDKSYAIFIENNVIGSTTAPATIGPQSTDNHNCGSSGTSSCAWGDADSAGIILLNSVNIQIWKNNIENSHGNGIELTYLADKIDFNQHVSISGNYVVNAGATNKVSNSYGIFVGGYSTSPVNSFVGPVTTVNSPIIAPAKPTASDIPGNTTRASKSGGLMFSGNPGGTTQSNNDLQ